MKNPVHRGICFKCHHFLRKNSKRQYWNKSLKNSQTSFSTWHQSPPPSEARLTSSSTRTARATAAGCASTAVRPSAEWSPSVTPSPTRRWRTTGTTVRRWPSRAVRSASSPWPRGPPCRSGFRPGCRPGRTVTWLMTVPPLWMWARMEWRILWSITRMSRFWRSVWPAEGRRSAGGDGEGPDWPYRTGEGWSLCDVCEYIVRIGSLLFVVEGVVDLSAGQGCDFLI